MINSKLLQCNQSEKLFSVRKPFTLLLVAAIILFIYYPTIFGEINKLDDINLIGAMANSPTWKLNKTFLPNMASGVYYRPITMITYQLDRDLLDLYPGFMKLENILLHIVNAFLVYWLAAQLLPQAIRNNSLVPLVSAVLFGLHPINTESVNWISGRTDVLACTFILLSANLIVKFIDLRTYRYLALSSLFLTLAFLSKETAIGFLPGAVVMILFANRGELSTALENNPGPSVAGGRLRVLSLLGILSSAVVVLILRLAAFSSHTTRFGVTFNVIVSDIPYSTMVVLNALAFYLKKFFFPLPLNFAIIEPDPLYDFLGLPILMFCLYLLIMKRTKASGIFLSGILLITPAFLVAFKQIAWTAYAERYLYMPSAFIVVAFVIWADRFLSTLSRPVVLKSTVVLILIALAGTATYHRNIVWKYNLTLFKDTLEKSPNYSIVRTLYGFTLIESGDYEGALDQFKQVKNQEDNRFMFEKAPPEIYALLGYAPDADFGVAYLLERNGRTDEAIASYERILGKTSEKMDLVLRRLIPLLLQSVVDAKTSDQINGYKKKLLQYTGTEFKYKNSDTLYWAGKILLVRGDRKGAREFFQRAYDRSDDSDDFKDSIKKIIVRLDGKDHSAVL